MGHVYQIEYEVAEVYEKAEKCFMRLRWKEGGKDREIVFPIAHGTFDLIKRQSQRHVGREDREENAESRKDA